MFMIDYKELSWWYWFVTVCLITAGIAGYQSGFILAICVTIFQLLHFTIREHSLTSFTVQVRFWYLMLLLAALPESLQIIYWILVVGTWARQIFGYCMMARCVSLLPWNRKQPLSLEFLLKTFCTRPVRGNILQGLSPRS
jgi:hypothetical protein